MFNYIIYLYLEIVHLCKLHGVMFYSHITTQQLMCGICIINLHLMHTYKDMCTAIKVTANYCYICKFFVKNIYNRVRKLYILI